MSFRTYQITVKAQGNAHILNYKGPKDEAKSFVSHHLHKLTHIHQYCTEKTGIIGAGERESTFMVLFGEGHTPRDPDAYKEKVERFFADISANVLTPETAAPLIPRINEIFNAHVYQKDSRKSTEQAASERAEIEAFQAEQKEKNRIKSEAYEAEKNKILVDYPYLNKNTNGKLSPWSQGAQNLKTELAHVFPGHPFSVTSETFSMGNSIRVHWIDGPTGKEVAEISDKYEQGTFDGMTESYTYHHSAWTNIFGGAKYVTTSRDISDAKLSEIAALLGYPDTQIERGCIKNIDQDKISEIRSLAHSQSFYVIPENPPAAGPAPADAADFSQGDIRVKLNPAKNGVEIYFPDRPDDSVISNLKSRGWRWARGNRCWYKRQTPEAIEFAHNLAKAA